MLCGCRLPADSEVAVELRLEDEISKHASIKMAGKLASVHVVNAGQAGVKVGP